MSRERFLPTSAITATLSSGVAAVVLGILLLENLLPAYAQPNSFNLGIFLLGFFVLIFILLAGMLFGAVLWLLVMRNWYSRDELASYFTQPDIVLISPLLSRLFERLY